ncbi:hypothetical protein CEXT_79961 [Caerostris extrusa]|uniref:Uncharacterized protein n=1 Tax=Caerostris extrusa TaxID=172846 RepID=A0AAV4TG08_CAEEX|nr:hypothetical protein CEXT_79961 [Caerostris extrusa]
MILTLLTPICLHQNLTREIDFLTAFVFWFPFSVLHSVSKNRSASGTGNVKTKEEKTRLKTAKIKRGFYAVCGKASTPYLRAKGHGDLSRVLRASTGFQTFCYLFVSTEMPPSRSLMGHRKDSKKRYGKSFCTLLGDVRLDVYYSSSVCCF